MEFFEFFEFSIFFNEIVLKLLLCAPRLEKREKSRKKFKNRSILDNFMKSRQTICMNPGYTCRSPR
jgi:hypothetical protein